MKRTAAWWSTPLVGLVGLIMLAGACGAETDTTGGPATPAAQPTTINANEPAAGAGDSDDSADVGDESLPTATPTPVSTATLAPTAIPVPPASAPDGVVALAVRQGPREQTTQSVPHVQLDAVPVPELDAELRRRAFQIPGVEDMPSEVSLAGARALWFRDDVDLARPEILLVGREFAHIHPDGSLHLWMPVDRAVEVGETGWGELHPWVGRDGFWDGVVLVFTPETHDEVDVVIQLLVESYNYVSGLALDPGNY